MSCWNKQILCLFIVYYLVEIFRFLYKIPFTFWYEQANILTLSNPLHPHAKIYICNAQSFVQLVFFGNNMSFLYGFLLFVALCISRAQSMNIFAHIYRNWDINVDTQNRKNYIGKSDFNAPAWNIPCIYIYKYILYTFLFATIHFKKNTF